MIRMLLGRRDQLLSRSLLAAVVLYLLLVCEEKRGPPAKEKTLYSPRSGQDSRAAPAAAGTDDYLRYMAQLEEEGNSSLASPVWQPTWCDSTSVLEGNGTCRFYTAGRWTVPLWERLRLDQESEASVAPPPPPPPSCGQAEFTRAFSKATCAREPGTRSLHFTLSQEQGPCHVPGDRTDALLQALGRRLRAKAVVNASGTFLSPVTFVLHGNSVQRGVLHGLIRMLRGQTDGFDRQTHSSLVYVATTKGDFVYFWDGELVYDRASLFAAVDRVIGGEVLLLVEYTFACTSFPLMTQLMEEAPASRYDVSSFLCNYEPREPFLYDHKKRVRSYGAALARELRSMNHGQVMVLFTGEEVLPRFCWNCLDLQYDPRLNMHNVFQRRLVLQQHAEMSEKDGSVGRAVLIPYEALVRKCAVTVRDAIHTETVLGPNFPAPVTKVSGQPIGENYPDLSHLVWYLFAMLDSP